MNIHFMLKTYQAKKESSTKNLIKISILLTFCRFPYLYFTFTQTFSHIFRTSFLLSYSFIFVHIQLLFFGCCGCTFVNKCIIVGNIINASYAVYALPFFAFKIVMWIFHIHSLCKCLFVCECVFSLSVYVIQTCE